MRVLRDLAQDLRYGARILRRSPAFTIAGVLTVALGVGATTAIFSVVNGLLLRPLPYPDPDRVVAVLAVSAESGRSTPRLTGGDLTDIEARRDIFAAASFCYGGQIGVRIGEASAFTGTYFVQPSFLDVLGVQPVAGRGFGPDDAGSAALVGSGLALRSFGSVSQALGRALVVDGRPYRIVGVLDAAHAYPRRAEAWIAGPPLGARLRQERTAYNYHTIARIRGDLAREQADSRLAALAARLAVIYPDSNRDTRFAVQPLREHLVASQQSTVVLLFGAVLLLQLIACANVSSLLLARATARTREMALRAALGASRSRLTRQLLVETLLLAAVGGTAGVFAAWLGTTLLVALAPADTPRLEAVTLDGRVLAFAALVTLATTVVVGLVPAWRASRTRALDALDQGGSRGSVGGAARARAVLVAVEVAAAVVLAVGAALLFRSFVALAGADLGFRPEHVLVVYAHAPASTDEEYVRTAQAVTDAIPALAAMPGVVSASAVMGLPAGRYSSWGGYAVEGIHRFAPGADLPRAGFRLAGPGYFRTLGVPLLRGRDFGASDTYTAPRVAIVSRALVRQSFGDTNPIGRRIQCGLDSLDPMTIVGVVDDVRQRSSEAPGADLYMPLAQHPAYANELQYVIRAAGDPSTLRETATAVLRRQLPGVATSPTTLEEMIADSIATPRFRTALVSAFAAVALLLAMTGVFGVMSYAAAQRTQEFGVRSALGADAAGILRLMLRQAIAVGGIGTAVGLVAAIAAARAMRSLLFGLTGVDAATCGVVVLAMLVVTILAALWPAWRASRVDPMVALREN